MNILFIIIGAILTADGVIMGVMANYNAGIALTLAVGLSMLIYGIFKNTIVNKTKNGILKLARFSYYLGLTILTLMIAFISIYGQLDNVAYNEDAVIVLGAGLRGDKITAPLYYRLEAAKEYYNKNPDAVIVVTGGMGSGETVTEASAMKKYLVENGIPENVILTEEKATSTYENLIFSKEILNDIFGENFDAVIVTNGFHIYRSQFIARQCEISATHLHGGINWYTIPVNYIRECAALIVTWIGKY